jgi:hypothetical protein
MTAPTTSSQLLKLTGLWVSETKTGRKMLSGEIRPGLKLLVLENPGATGNQPRYEAFLAPRQKREQQDTPPAPEAF